MPSDSIIQYSPIGHGFAPGPLLRSIEDLDQKGIKPETVLRVETARVAYANYALLQHDFAQLREEALENKYPFLKSLTGAEKQRAIGQIIDDWMLRHTAYISQSQADQTLVNTPIVVGEGRTTAHRPPRYGRALVFTATDVPPSTEWSAGLIDVKGTGVAPGVQPLHQLHKNGLYQLGYAFVELIVQHLLQRIFWHSAAHFQTLPIYGILDLGFDELDEKMERCPAGMLLRRAHRRPKNSGGLFAFGSTGQLVQLAAEKLLRKYGITSVNNITTVRVWREEGDLRICYGEQNIDFFSAKQKAEIERVSHHQLGMGELRFEGINLQHTREIDLNPPAATLVDFQTYTVKNQFDRPVLSLVSDKLLRWGGSIWPESDKFVQPDPVLQIPFDLVQATGEIWGYNRGMESKKINSLCFGLAEDFQAKRIDRAILLDTLQRYLDALTAHWKA